MNPLFPVETEEALIGSLLIHPERYEQVEGLLTEGTFASPRCRQFFAAMTDCYEAEGTWDAPTLIEKGLSPDDYHVLMELAGAVSLVGRNADQVADASALRSVQARLGTIMGQIQEGSVTLPDVQDELGLLSEIASAGTANSPSMSIIEFMDRIREEPPQWVVKGILREKERLLFVGPEGMGKSTLNYQVGITTAIGCHPFSTAANLEPRRVLIVDCENSGMSSSVDGTFMHATPEGMVGFAARQYPSKGTRALLDKNLHVWFESGLNLKLPGWRRTMDLVMRDTHPELVIIGPVYRVWPREDGDDWDSQAQGFQRYMDSLRRRFGCAVWIEHHAGKGSAHNKTIQSYGSSFWERWPEVGRGAVPVPEEGQSPYDAVKYKLTRMRGDRGPRDIPAGIQHGAALEWPWTTWGPSDDY